MFNVTQYQVSALGPLVLNYEQWFSINSSTKVG